MHEVRDQGLLVVSLAVILEEISDNAGVDPTDKIIGIL